MNKQVCSNWRMRKWWTTMAVMTTLLVAPLFGLSFQAEAKPPRHAPAHGYRNKSKSKWSKNRSHKNWRKQTKKNRRYRLRYRTKRDRNGKPYRYWFRQYY